MHIWKKWETYLIQCYGPTPPPPDVRYQLFHAFVAGMMLCREMHKTNRILEIEQFCTTALQKIDQQEKKLREEAKAEAEADDEEPPNIIIQ